MPVYPGNPHVIIKPKKGATSMHSEITFGSHTGTHLDVPKHVFKNGWGIEKASLAKLIGPCRVIDMTGCKDAIGTSDLKKGERLLLKTKNSARGFKKFYNDYAYLDGDAAEYLLAFKPALVGIDSLSIKQRGSPDNRPHTALLQKGVLIVEGLNLRSVSAGAYELVCLPLLFTGLDGSPARAILIKR